ncbi:hypothetical protein MRX96_058484 [Rhipicephalus microplus]
MDRYDRAAAAFCPRHTSYTWSQRFGAAPLQRWSIWSRVCARPNSHLIRLGSASPTKAADPRDCAVTAVSEFALCCGELQCTRHWIVALRQYVLLTSRPWASGENRSQTVMVRLSGIVMIGRHKGW